MKLITKYVILDIIQIVAFLLFILIGCKVCLDNNYEWYCYLIAVFFGGWGLIDGLYKLNKTFKR